jgi:hypothetical protein
MERRGSDECCVTTHAMPPVGPTLTRRFYQGFHASQGDTGHGVALLVTALQRTNHGIRINTHTKVNLEAELCVL